MPRILDTINCPTDLKKLSEAQLPILAQEIREELIKSLSKTGGHLGPNLGVVELTIAWHYVFNSPEDRLIMDVSHQAYVHKMLTGRAKLIGTIRQPGGLNGFMLRTESPHDHYGAGHAGTGLSAALGMAAARDLLGGNENITALCGDAAFTCGITFEALNNITNATKRLLVILNDNKWSIDKNVGAIANYLNRITTSSTYSHLHERAKRFLEWIGGQGAVHIAHKIEESIKGLMFPSTLFEEMGLTYYGPIDGHDIPTLIKTFEFLKRAESPVILHVLTKKGKGFKPAELAQMKFHGLGPFDPETGETPKSGQKTYSEILGETLANFADRDQRVVAITGAMPSGTGLIKFQPRHPKRYFDVGIAEEHAVIFAAGMATRGLKPFAVIYSTFLQRAFDPIVHDVCLQNLPVVFPMDRAGLSGDDGPTHHGLFDIAYLRGIPNIIHMAPKDEDEFVDMLYTCLKHEGPSAIRYPRGCGPGAKIKDQPQLLEIGKGEITRHGSVVSLWGLGTLHPLAEETADLLLRHYNIHAEVVNPRFIKPLDRDLLRASASRCELICTFEDHVLNNGFGAAVICELSDMNMHIPVVRIGWPDQFIEHGKVEWLREKYGVTARYAVQKIIEKLRACNLPIPGFEKSDVQLQSSTLTPS